MKKKHSSFFIFLLALDIIGRINDIVEFIRNIFEILPVVIEVFRNLILILPLFHGFSYVLFIILVLVLLKMKT
jgi:hypothetical protein